MTGRATRHDTGSHVPSLRLFAVLLLAAVFVQACGTGGGSSELAGLLALVPADAENVEVYDFEQMRREEPPGTLRDEFEDLSGTGLEELGVLTDELTTLVFAAGDDWYLIVVEGDVDLEHARDQLESAAYESDQYRGLELWVEPWGGGGALYPLEAVALLEDRGRMVMGDAEVVRRVLRILDRGSGSLLDDADSDLGRALKKAGEGWVSFAQAPCQDFYEIRGCRAVGASLRRGDDDYLVEATFAFLFRDERTAESGMDELESQIEEDSSFDFDIDDVRPDGDFVIVTASGDEDDLYGDEADLSEEEDSAPAPSAAATTRDAPDARDDHGDSADEATSVTVGDAVVGVLGHEEDVDYFAFAAERGETYRIDVELGTLDDSIAVLFAPDLRELEFDDDGGDSLGSRITWRVAESGTHYVGVGGWGGTGSYTLAVTLVRNGPGTEPPDTGDDHGDAADEATSIAVGGAVAGVLGHEGDVDYFAFVAERGATYRIDVDLGTLDDSVAALFAPDLRELAFDDDGGISLGSRITWTAAESGPHYVGVAGWGSDTGSYTLTVTATGDARGTRDDRGDSAGEAGFAPYPGDADDNEITSGANSTGSCIFNTRSAEPHRSGDSVVAQGWWIVSPDSECPVARVNVILYGWWCDSEGCRWRVIADGSSVVRPEGASDQAVTAQRICVSDETTGMRSVVDVDLLDMTDTGERSVTVANVNCRPPNLQRALGEPEASEETGEAGSGPPDSPANQRYEYDGSAIVLRWDASDRADSYAVYYDDFFDSGCRAGPDGPSFCEELASDLRDTDYTHTNPDPRENYYWVVACNRFGCSAVDSENPARVAGLPPAVPANQRYEYDGSAIVLRWDASDGADFYTVYYDDFFDSACSLGSRGPSFCEELATDLSSTDYTHASPDRNENYYWVVACNRFGCSAIDSENPAQLEPAR